MNVDLDVTGLSESLKDLGSRGFAGSLPMTAELEAGVQVDSLVDGTGRGPMLGVDLVDFSTTEAQVALARLDGPLRARILRVCLVASGQSHDDGVERFVMLRAVPRGKVQSIVLEIVRGRAAMERRAEKSRAFGRPLVVRLAPGSST